jgi:hypothetical protein
VALGRPNWIHIGSERAGPRVAGIVSVVETYRRLKIPIRDYLCSILPGLANFPINRIVALTSASCIAAKEILHFSPRRNEKFLHFLQEHKQRKTVSKPNHSTKTLCVLAIKPGHFTIRLLNR